MFSNASSPFSAQPWLPQSLPAPLCRLFLQYGQLRSVAKGQPLAELGEDSLMLVQQGLIGLLQPTEHHSKEMLTALLPPLRIYGFRGYLHGQACQDKAVALRPSQVWVLPLAQLQPLLASHQYVPLRRLLHSYCLHCLTVQHCGCFVIATEATPVRLARLFSTLILAFSASENNEKYEIPLKLTNEELRKVIYTTKKTINTILPSWKKAGLYVTSGESTFISKSII